MDGQRYEHSYYPRRDMPQVWIRAIPAAGLLQAPPARMENDFEVYKPAMQI